MLKLTLFKGVKMRLTFLRFKDLIFLKQIFNSIPFTKFHFWNIEFHFQNSTSEIPKCHFWNFKFHPFPKSHFGNSISIPYLNSIPFNSLLLGHPLHVFIYSFIVKVIIADKLPCSVFQTLKKDKIEKIAHGTIITGHC